MLEEVQQLEDDKKENEKKKIEKENQKELTLQKFFRCKESCVCDKSTGKCEAFGLKMCPNCRRVLKGACGRKECVNLNGGVKPTMMIASCNKKVLNVLDIYICRHHEMKIVMMNCSRKTLIKIWQK